jgi:glycosyltransferase involved in cell wall biosynthesis
MTKETVRDVGHWLILAETQRLRWGGDLRRYHIFRRLATSTHSTIHRAFSAADLERVERLLAAEPGTGGLPVASAEFLAPDAIALAGRLGKLSALDVHDDQIVQIEGLGLEIDADRLAEIAATRDASLGAFRWHIANSRAFARLAGLEPRRVIIAPNGSDPSKVVPGPWPETPTIGLVSGAAPGRGIELLIAAVAILRSDRPSLRLLLALAATGPESDEYLGGLKARLSDEPWISFATAPYAELGALLGQATVLCVPHPPNRYWDAVEPIKLFDSMAAARPIVTTPRTATAALVERYRCGAVARGDSAADLAAAIEPLLADRNMARTMGQAGRAAVEADFDWRRISARLSATLQRRTDRTYVLRAATAAVFRRVRRLGHDRQGR